MSVNPRLNTNTLLQRFEYADQRMPLAMTDNTQKYYLHYDQVGSLRAISDTSHNIIKEVTYDTFGTILTDTNPSFKVPFGFAGGLYDTDTKLTRFGYRDYDAQTGKWTAKDPIDFAGGDSNLYGYVLGDPVGFVDPTGLIFEYEREWWQGAFDMAKNYYDMRDANGQIVKEITYDTFGNILTDSNEAFKIPFGFAGGLCDTDTGLTRFGYRDYDSYTGKWTAKDPIDFDGGDSNLYGYVLGDPVGFVDPSGLIPIVIPFMPAIIELAGYAGLGAATTYAVTEAYNNSGDVANYSKGGNQNKRDSGLSGYSDAEIAQMARDKNIDKTLRERAKTEEKARGSRNKQKRNNCE